jgi:N-acetylneuraminic acid mutarotase
VIAVFAVNGLLTLPFAAGAPTAAATTPDTYAAISWSSGVPSPVRRLEANAAVVQEKLYVLGGYITRWNPDVRSDVYDPSTRSWARLADMPVGTTHGGVAAVGTDVFVAGGYVAKSGGGQIFASTNVWRYDTVGNKWTAMPPLPSARGSGAMVAVGRKLFFFGGASLSRAEKSQHWMLDLDGTAKWVSRAPLPHVRTHFGAVLLEGLVYSIGGEIGHDSGAVVQDVVDVYDPVSNTWSSRAPLPKPRAHVSASTVVTGGRILVLGGDSPANTAIAEVTAYAPESNQWQELTPMPGARFAGVAGAFASGELFFTTGGLPRSATSWRGLPISSAGA